MKKYSRLLIFLAAGLASGAAANALFASHKKKKTGIKRGDLWIQRSGKEKLTMVKSKLEMHKLRLEKVLAKINLRLEVLQT